MIMGLLTGQPCTAPSTHVAQFSMRQLRYSVVMRLDGSIARAKGECDWIANDPAVYFGAMLRQFDALLMGRRWPPPLVDGKIMPNSWHL
jgi:hypothetical protein